MAQTEEVGAARVERARPLPLLYLLCVEGNEVDATRDGGEALRWALERRAEFHPGAVVSIIVRHDDDALSFEEWEALRDAAVVGLEGLQDEDLSDAQESAWKKIVRRRAYDGAAPVDRAVWEGLAALRSLLGHDEEALQDALLGVEDGPREEAAGGLISADDLAALRALESALGGPH